MRVRVSKAMAVPAHVKALSVSGGKESHLRANLWQENKQVLQGSNALSLGTKLLKDYAKRNTHEQWDKHNQEKCNAGYLKQLLTRFFNQAKHHGTLGSKRYQRHLRCPSKEKTKH